MTGPPAPGRALRGLWLLAGVLALGAAAHALARALGGGTQGPAGVEMAVPAGLAVLLIGAAIEAPRPPLVRWVLIAVSAVVIVLGGATLVSRLLAG
jgi:hypothetical protein